MPVGTQRLDVVASQTVVIELKTVKCLNRHHSAQIWSYLKATGFRITFALGKAEFRRVKHNPDE